MITRDMKEYYTRMWLQNGNAGCGTNIYVVIIIGVILLLSSCATRARVEYRDVNHYITNFVHDTLRDVVTDSVYVETVTKDDTVFLTKYKERIRLEYRVVERHDTCWRDSLVTEYKETENEVVKIPKIFWFSFVFSILVLIFAIIKLLRWLRII